MPVDKWRSIRSGAAYVLSAIVIFYVSLLPLGSTLFHASLPDLLYCQTMAWVMRRPDSAPLLLVAIVSLSADVTLGRPLGLWAGLMILGSEFFRDRETGKGIQMRLFEWLSVSVIFVFMLAAQAMILKLSFSVTPTFNSMMIHAFSTILAYPIVVACLHWIVGVRAPLPAVKSRSIGRVS